MSKRFECRQFVCVAIAPVSQAEPGSAVHAASALPSPLVIPLAPGRESAVRDDSILLQLSGFFMCVYPVAPMCYLLFTDTDREKRARLEERDFPRYVISLFPVFIGVCGERSLEAKHQHFPH